ncbi:uncharacterized protein ZBAI_03062 [Zygosaccharomyces bailii ISA1307]|nr:uncharacterized protein ZBAI_03062 [Zygosaccharomyces bailii ISA1307]
MSDEDHKLTVETETVEAPGASLLPSTGNGGPNENGPETGNNEQDSVNVVTSKDISPVQFASSYAAAAHAAAAAAAAQAPASSEASVNLINHNPLSPHAIQSLKNKKSSLLINNERNREMVGARGGEDEHPLLRKHQLPRKLASIS